MKKLADLDLSDLRKRPKVRRGYLIETLFRRFLRQDGAKNRFIPARRTTKNPRIFHEKVL